MLAFFDWLFVFMRASGFLLILPLFSGGYLPIRMRIAFGALLGLLAMPGLNNSVDVASLHLSQLVLLLLREVSLGLFMGYICRLIFYAVELAGHLMSTDMGLQMSTLITPDNPLPVPIPGVVLNLLAMMLFVTLDIHLLLIILFQRSYEVLPLGAGEMSESLFDDMTLRTGRVFLIAVLIAAPLKAVGFLISIGLVMLGRAVPQMNVFFLSFTVRLLAGAIVFGFTIRLAAGIISDQLRRLPEDLLGLARLLAG